MGAPHKGTVMVQVIIVTNISEFVDSTRKCMNDVTTLTYYSFYISCTLNRLPPPPPHSKR